MDPFDRLPWFALRDILSYLPDLPTLHRLCNASPAVAAFLRNERGLFPEIVEAIIAHPMQEKGLIPQAQFSIRTLVLIWWRMSSSDSKLDSGLGDECPLPKSYTTILAGLRESKSYKMETQNYGTGSLPRSTPCAVLRRLLIFMGRLRQIAHACFHALIANCMTLKLEHVKYGHCKLLYGRPPFNRFKRRKGKPYIPVDIGAPTWLEEQRLILAILRITLFFALQNAANAHVISDTKKETQIYQVGEFWYQIFGRGAQSEQVETVLWWLSEEVGSGGGDAAERMERWIFSSSLADNLRYCCSTFTSMTEEQWIKAEQDMDTRYSTRGSLCLHYCAMHTLSPLEYVDNSVFQPFGVSFWESSRMDALGFPGSDYLGDMWFVWSSILTEEQWDEITREQQERITLGY